MRRRERIKGLKPLAEELLNIDSEEAIVMVFPHIRADGDAYGSSFALYGALSKLGYKVVVIAEEAIYDNYAFMPYQENLYVYEDLSAKEKAKLEAKGNVAIQVDSSELNRLGARAKLFKETTHKFVIDHHISPLENNEHVFIDKDAGANTELVYIFILLIGALANKKLLDDKVALALYAGLLTDTGGFSYDNTSSETLKIASELLAFNIPVAKLNNHLFKEVSYRNFNIEAILAQKTKLSEAGELSYLIIDKDLIEEYDLTDEDISPMPAKIRDIKGVKVSLILRNNLDGNYRGNLRSVGKYDVAKIAQKLNGGGHINAAGFTIEAKEDIHSVASKVIDIIKTELKIN